MISKVYARNAKGQRKSNPLFRVYQFSNSLDVDHHDNNSKSNFDSNLAHMQTSDLASRINSKAAGAGLDPTNRSILDVPDSDDDLLVHKAAQVVKKRDLKAERHQQIRESTTMKEDPFLQQ